MQNNPICIDAIDAHDISRDVFSLIYPTRTEWFELAWEELLASAWSEPRLPVPTGSDALGAVGEMTKTEHEMVNLVGTFIELFVISMPVGGDILIERLREICARKGYGSDRTKAISQCLQSHLNIDLTPELSRRAKKPAPITSPDVVALWSKSRSGKVYRKAGLTEKYGRDRFRANRNSCGILIWGSHVTLNRDGKFTDVSMGNGRRFWLFLMLLRQRGEALPVRESYKKAWTKYGVDPDRAPEYDIVDGYLKMAIQEIKRAIPEAFMAPPTKTSYGYRCVDTAPFYMIIPSSWEERITLDTQGDPPL